MTMSEQTHMENEIVALIPALRAFARRFHPSKSDAEDLVQETLMKALGNLDKFSADGSLKSWMFTIMRNTFCTKFKVARREAPSNTECVALVSAVEPSQQAAIEMDELRKAIERLPESQRKLVIEIAIHGESYEAMAQKMGCAVGTVKSRLNRARHHLYEKLDQGS